MTDEFFGMDEEPSKPKNSFWSGSSSTDDTADLHLYDDDASEEEAAAKTEPESVRESEPEPEQEPEQVSTAEASEPDSDGPDDNTLPPWLGLRRQVIDGRGPSRSQAYETARQSTYAEDKVVVRAPINAWEDEVPDQADAFADAPEEELAQEEAVAEREPEPEPEERTFEEPEVTFAPASATVEEQVTEQEPATQPDQQQPVMPREERMIPAGTERIDVDGDYRLEPANRVGDDGIGDVLYGTSAGTTNGEESTLFLSGPPSGLSKRGKRLRVILIMAAVLITLIALYGVGVNRFSTRYLPRTSIYGCNVSGMTSDEAQHALENETKTYRCALESGDFGLTVTGSDISLERNEEQLITDTFGTQNPYAWPLSIVMPTTLTPSQDLSFDEDKLSSIVSRAVDSYNAKALSSSSATITYDEESSTYVLGGSVSGKAVDNKTVDGAVLEDVKAMHPQCQIDEEKAFRAAQLTDLPTYRDTVEHANAVRSSNIDVLVNGEPVATSEAAQNAAWVSVGDGPRIVVDEEGVRFWAESVVADATFHTDDWNAYYLDTDSFVSQFSERLASGRTDGFEAPMIDERTREGLSRDNAYEHTSWNSELGRYIDVDLTSQFARLFDEKGEVLWESAFVSGDLFEGHSTVEGIFNIYSKEMGVVLVGLDYDNDGNPDYESYVNYWMPFYGGYGLHDATWRWTFGGDLYQYDGSHGCVNLPYEKARDLFEITYVGEVVNVHW